MFVIRAWIVLSTRYFFVMALSVELLNCSKNAIFYDIPRSSCWFYAICTFRGHMDIIPCDYIIYKVFIQSFAITLLSEPFDCKSKTQYFYNIPFLISGPCAIPNLMVIILRIPCYDEIWTNKCTVYWLPVVVVRCFYKVRYHTVVWVISHSWRYTTLLI